MLRRVGGYNLDEFVDPDGAVQPREDDRRLRRHARPRPRSEDHLVPLPNAKAVLTIRVRRSARRARRDAAAILRHRPSAVEVMDRFILDHAKREPGARSHAPQHSATAIPARCCASSSTTIDAEDLPPRLDALERDLAASRLRLSMAPRDRRRPTRRAIWSFREAVARPVDGDERRREVAVVRRRHGGRAGEAARLHRAVSADRQRHDTTAGVYAHASVGCLHVRPGRQPEDRRRRARRSSRSRTTSPISCSNSAARCRASTATAWCAVRSWKRCSGRCSTKRSARSSARSIRTASSIPARSSTARR